MGTVILIAFQKTTQYTSAMADVFQYDDYKVYLRTVFEEKTKKNPSFSLRAFARQCSLSPSTMSRILNGQRKLSPTQAVKILPLLQLNSDEMSHFFTLMAFSDTENPQQKSKLLSAIRGRQKNPSQFLSHETFQTIAEWYHFAILAMTKMRGFRADAKWIAPRLGLKPFVAQAALDRLMTLGLLKKQGLRYVSGEGKTVETPHDLTSLAVQENHRQQLQKATEALVEFDVDLREFANVSLALNLRDIPKVKQRIRSFLDAFVDDLEKDSADEVFQCNLQFYPLTTIDKSSVKRTNK